MTTENDTSHAVREANTVKQVRDALRVTVGWKTPSVGMTRKLSSVQFIIRSLRRHLEALWSLEEQNGYMRQVRECKPNLTEKAELLLSEHMEFRKCLEELIPSIDQISPRDEKHFNFLCKEINLLLDELERHDHCEVELLQEAFLQDDGGEG